MYCAPCLCALCCNSLHTTSSEMSITLGECVRFMAINNPLGLHMMSLGGS